MLQTRWSSRTLVLLTQERLLMAETSPEADLLQPMARQPYSHDCFPAHHRCR